MYSLGSGLSPIWIMFLERKTEHGRGYVCFVDEKFLSKSAMFYAKPPPHIKASSLQRAHPIPSSENVSLISVLVTFSHASLHQSLCYCPASVVLVLQGAEKHSPQALLWETVQPRLLEVQEWR
jgi:hypothetical protein